MKKMSWGLLCAFLLSGCALHENAENVSMIKPESYQESHQETVELEEKNNSQEAEFNNYFYYSTMDVEQQKVYKEILHALENYVEEMPLSTTQTDVVDKVFQCVLMDHPEIFYADGYSFVKYTLSDEVKKITFSGTYICDKEEKELKEAQLEQAALELLKGISADSSDYEKVKYVYETIIRNTEYNMDAEDNQNICSVFLNGASVCQGYAKAVQYLLEKLQVPATLVIGTVDNGEGHAWNMVKIENAFYYVDATWGDASYLFHVNEDSAQIQNTPEINYDYLCVTTEEILRTHCISDMYSMPLCDSMNANYYVREGAYFTVMDERQLEQLIADYREQGRESVTLKCADDEVYNIMVEELIEKQRIFNYLVGENNSILYTDAPKQRSITFWL